MADKAAILTAQVERFKTARALLDKEAKDLPPIILVWGQGIVSGALGLFAEEERERVEQMPTREHGLLVWADADPSHLKFRGSCRHTSKQ